MNEQQMRDSYTVFCGTNHTEMSYEQYCYKHLKNPELDADIAVFVHYEEGIPCGTKAFMSGTLYCDDISLPVTYSCDVAVLPDYQGRGIFSRILKEATDRCIEGRPLLIYATPNRNSYPGFKKSFTELGQLESWSVPLHPIRLGMRKLLHRTHAYSPFEKENFIDGEGNEWQVSLTCPFAAEELCAVNQRPGVHLGRTAAFYRWKVDQNERSKFLYYKVTYQKRLTAFFILQRREGELTLCDWVLPESGGDILLKVLAKHARAYWDILTVPMLNPKDPAYNCFKAAGWRLRKGKNPFLLYPTGVNPELWVRLCDLSGWHTCYMDFDTIMN